MSTPVLMTNIFISLVILSCTSAGQRSLPPSGVDWKNDPFLDTLEQRTLRYFLDTTPRASGLTPDRWPTPAPSSIAAVGFALTCTPIAAERGMITREEAADRTRVTLNTLLLLPQGESPDPHAGHKGFFYHFVDQTSGLRAWKCELSTIDTGLLMAGILFAQSYFDREDPVETTIRALADSLYRRVDWMWFTAGTPGLRTGWYPERGFNDDVWRGYNEAWILYILALGSPTHPIPDWYISAWYEEYRWEGHGELPHVAFGPLFGHQYSHCWIDFRGIRDRTMWGRGIDYFENSRRATYFQRAYGIANPQGFRDYSGDIWGWTACDGPKDTLRVVDGSVRKFWTYRAREVAPAWVEDDGTIAPTAAGGSIAFAPEICVPALRAMREKYGDRLWREYGFADAFNPSYEIPGRKGEIWVGADYIGIDQGPIAIMIENLRTGFVWETMKQNPYVIAGLRRAGFSGGWLGMVRSPEF